jgi:uncharacterized membrane protein
LTLLKQIQGNIKKRLLAGVLLFLPFGVVLLVMRWLFGGIRSFLKPVIEGLILGFDQIAFLGIIPEEYISIIATIASILILLLSLYLIGSLGQFLIGRKLIALSEAVLLKIPLISTLYSALKQVIDTFSQDKTAFKSVVIVEFPRPDFLSLAFLTGYIEDNEGKRYCKVFVPTSPNPTTGFFEIVPEEKVKITTLTIEEGFKMIISAGVVSYDIFKEPESKN